MAMISRAMENRIAHPCIYQVQEACIDVSANLYPKKSFSATHPLTFSLSEHGRTMGKEKVRFALGFADFSEP
jgi:hypothetical protein